MISRSVALFSYGESVANDLFEVVKKDTPLNIHFLFQCHMTVTMVLPLPYPFRRPAAGPQPIKSNGRSDHERRFFRPIVTEVNIRPVFHKPRVF